MHTVQGIEGNGQTENMTVDLTEAGLGQENQLIITGEDGQGYPVSVSGMITVPVSSMYQMVANIQHLHQNGDGTVCLTPIQVPQSQLHSLRHLSASNKVIQATLKGQTSNLIYHIKQEASSEASANNNNHLEGSQTGGANGNPFVGKEESLEARRATSAIEHADSSHTQAIIDAEGNLIIQMRTAPAPPATSASSATPAAPHSAPPQPVKVDFEP